MGCSPPTSSPSSSRKRTKRTSTGVSSELRDAAAAALFISSLRRASGLGAPTLPLPRRGRTDGPLDDHLLRLVLAGEDAKDRVARETHAVVLAVAVRRAVLGRVELHLALQPAHEMRQLLLGRTLGEVRQRGQLRRRREAVPVWIRLAVLAAAGAG